MLPSAPEHSRWIEPALLITAALFLVVNALSLALLRPADTLAIGLRLVVWGVCAFGGWRWLNRILPQRDPLLFPLALFLSGWGMLLIQRLQPIFGERQMLWLALSTAAMIGVAALPHVLRWLRGYRYLLLISGLALLVATILLGVNPSGLAGAPQLWLGFGSIFFQPSEALKIILVAFLASYLAEQAPALQTERAAAGRVSLSPRIVGPMLLMWGVSVVVLVWQRDLGTAMLFFLAFVLLLYLATGSITLLLIGALLVVVAGGIAYFAFGVVRLRVDIWLNPWLEADGRAYQIVQSLMAFAAGGIGGQGIGQGSPGYIPVVHSDFIFAALAEEWGLLGVVAQLAAWAMLILRGFRIAARQNGHLFHTLLGAGLTLMIALQTLLIMGGVLKLIPLTGVTLPFMSYGGSSLLMSFVVIGLLLRLSAEERE